MPPPLWRSLIFLWLGFLSSYSYAADPTCRLRFQNDLPRIHTSSNRDAYRCVGYLHGRYRAFQMDYLRRIALGRASEISGFKMFRSDYFLRLLGLEQRAQHLYETLNNDIRERLWYYSAGVNDGFTAAEKSGVREWRDLGISVEPWHPVDSLLLLLVQSAEQTSKSFHQEIQEASWAQFHRLTSPHLFSEDGAPWQTTVIKKHEFETLSPPTLDHPPSPLPTTPPPIDPNLELPPVETGSNSWVLAPKRSLTRTAWLANDPHLAPLTPPFWFWLEVKTPHLHVAGATLPGVPLIPSGMNAAVAWGLTNAYFDVADIVSVPESELQHLTEKRPWFRVRIGPLLVPWTWKKHRHTKEGWPLLPLPAPSGRVFVLRWTTLDVTAYDLQGIFDLWSVNSAQEMDKLLSQIRLPGWNFVFADIRGSIGYRATGKLLRRRSSSPLGIRESSVEEASHLPLLSSQEQPRLLQPKRGYIVTANNQHFPPLASFHGGRAYTDSFRAFRIEEQLQKIKRHSVETLQALQCDTQFVEARFFVPLLLSRLPTSPSTATARVTEIFQDWMKKNYAGGLDCIACGVYRRWMDRFEEEVKLPTRSLFYLLTGHPHSPFTQEKLSSLALKALDKTLEDLHGFPEWGALHQAPFAHFSGRSEWAWKEWLPVPGDTDSVNAAGATWDKNRYRVDRSSASQRLIVQLSRPPRAWRALAGPNLPDVLPPETSLVNPTSPWIPWRNCTYERFSLHSDWNQSDPGEVQLNFDPPPLVRKH